MDLIGGTGNNPAAKEKVDDPPPAAAARSSTSCTSSRATLPPSVRNLVLDEPLPGRGPLMRSSRPLRLPSEFADGVPLLLRAGQAGGGCEYSRFGEEPV